MAAIDLAELTAPIAADDPCGPDLDLAGDADYMNFVARAEGLLPASFFDSEGKPFDRSSIDFPAEVESIKSFLGKTRDLRLLVLLAKFLVLNRDLEGFATSIRAIATLLREQWEAVHPRGEDGDYSFRMAALASLDDLPPVVMPLQYLPLVEHRRFGAITYRHQMVVSGQARPRDGEEVPDANIVEQALANDDLARLIARRNLAQSVHDALAEMRRISTEQAGYEQAVSLDRLPQLVDKILAFLDGAVAKRDPSAALAPAAATGAVPAEGADKAPDSAETAPAAGPGTVRSNADAAAALAAVADYFSRREPSNPALLLVRQSEQLIGKSFLDVMRILVPAHVDQAIVHIGGEHTFELPIERLAGFAPASESTDGWAESAGEAVGAGANGGAPSSVPQFQATSRREAVALIDLVAAYFRAVEPSSPIPYLADRARGLADRDFLSILKDFLPETALKSTKDGSW